MVKKILEHYMKKNWKKNRKEFQIEKVIKKKERGYMLNGKVIEVHSIVGLIKKTM